MSQFSLLLVPFSCISFLVRLMRWTHTKSHFSRILRWRSSGWRSVVGYYCALLWIWGWKLIIVGKCFAMGFRGTTTISLLASGNSSNDLLWIYSLILSQKTQGLLTITYITLMKLISKALCLPVGASTIPVLLLVIQKSARYRILQSLLLLILLLAIQIRRKLKRREGGIMWRMGVTEIWGHLMERYIWIGVSGTAMAVRFGLGAICV